MTIEFRSPTPNQEPALRGLFTEAFGDEGFTELFFRHGYAPERCMIAHDGQLLAAAHWFDCTRNDKKAAYLYGIAAVRSCRRQGIGSRLIRETIAVLKARGYEEIFLVPAEASLFSYYERFGFRTVGTVHESAVAAGSPIPIRKLTTEGYAAARKRLLPQNAIIQDGPCLALLAGYAEFFATEKSVFSRSDGMIWEFLGDESEIPGVIAALNLDSATVRTPGPGRDFARGLEISGPVYLGLALD